MSYREFYQQQLFKQRITPMEKEYTLRNIGFVGGFLCLGGSEGITEKIGHAILESLK